MLKKSHLFPGLCGGHIGKVKVAKQTRDVGLIPNQILLLIDCCHVCWCANT